MHCRAEPVCVLVMERALRSHRWHKPSTPPLCLPIGSCSLKPTSKQRRGRLGLLAVNSSTQALFFCLGGDSPGQLCSQKFPQLGMPAHWERSHTQGAQSAAAGEGEGQPLKPFLPRKTKMGAFFSRAFI